MSALRDVLLYDNEWVQLRILSNNTKVKGYVYSHEKRCNGKIVAFLPYREVENGNIELLFRFEDTPCWSMDDFPQVIPCSFTGGVDTGSTVYETIIKELEEESGYEMSAVDAISLGTCRGTKSTDTMFHLFTFNLTQREPTKPLTVESPHEGMSYCNWVKLEDLDDEWHFQDPLVSVLYTKLFSFGYI